MQVSILPYEKPKEKKFQRNPVPVVLAPARPARLPSTTTTMDLGRAMREVKNFVCQYSDAEQMLREATCSDPPIRPSDSLMREVSRATFSTELDKLLSIIWKRMADTEVCYAALDMKSCYYATCYPACLRSLWHRTLRNSAPPLRRSIKCCTRSSAASCWST